VLGALPKKPDIPTNLPLLIDLRDFLKKPEEIFGLLFHPFRLAIYHLLLKDEKLLVINSTPSLGGNV